MEKGKESSTVNLIGILLWLAAVFSGIIGFYLILPSIINYVGLEQLTNSERLTATSIAASTILTYALIIIYKNLGNIQKEQTNILREQKRIQGNQVDWMEASHKPVIEIVNCNVDNPFGEDTIELSISNKGNGPAINLRALLRSYPMGINSDTNQIDIGEHIVIDDFDFDINDFKYPNPLEIGNEDPEETSDNIDLRSVEVPLESPNENGELPKSTIGVQGPVIYPEEEWTFGTYALVQRVDDFGHTMKFEINFSDVSNIILNAGITRFEFHLFVLFDNILGETDGVRVFGGTVDLKQDMNLREAVEMKRDSFGAPKDDEELDASNFGRWGSG